MAGGCGHDHAMHVLKKMAKEGRRGKRGGGEREKKEGAKSSTPLVAMEV